jgi:hypothetical protein
MDGYQDNWCSGLTKHFPNLNLEQYRSVIAGSITLKAYNSSFFTIHLQKYSNCILYSILQIIFKSDKEGCDYSQTASIPLILLRCDVAMFTFLHHFVHKYEQKYEETSSKAIRSPTNQLLAKER